MLELLKTWMYHLKLEEVSLDERAKEKAATGSKSRLKQTKLSDENLVVQTTMCDMLLGRDEGER